VVLENLIEHGEEIRLLVTKGRTHIASDLRCNRTLNKCNTNSYTRAPRAIRSVSQFVRDTVILGPYRKHLYVREQ
jgi:hypothetical protein